MKIRIFLLRTENSGSAKRTEGELRFVFKNYLADENGVEAFSSVDEAAVSVAKAFTDSHAVLFLAEPAKYAQTKRVLAKALSFELKNHSELLLKACDSAGMPMDENSEFAFTHAYLPDAARIFTSADSLYNGFSVASGNQTIILMPLERGRTDTMLTSQVVPYLNAAYHIAVDVRALRTYNTAGLSALCAEKDLGIAIAATNTAAYFKDYISADPALSERVSLGRKAEPRGAAAPVDYVVNLSIAALEFCNTEYGAAMSNAFYTGDSPEGEKLVYLAVTNERETAVRTVRSVPGEDIPSLLTRCCSDLTVFLSDVIENDEERRIFADEKAEKTARKYKIAGIVTSALIVCVAVFGLLFFRANDYSLKTWYQNAKSFLFPGTNIVAADTIVTFSPAEITTVVGTVADVMQTTAAAQPASETAAPAAEETAASAEAQTEAPASEAEPVEASQNEPASEEEPSYEEGGEENEGGGEYEGGEEAEGGEEYGGGEEAGGEEEYG